MHFRRGLWACTVILGYLVAAADALRHAREALHEELAAVGEEIAEKEFAPHGRADELRALEDEKRRLEIVEELIDTARDSVSEATEMHGG